MRFTTALALACFLSFRAVAQDDHKARNEALCKFSGGRSITVTYPHSEKTGITTLRTTEDLATVHGVNLSAGAYELRPEKNSNNNWVLGISRIENRKLTHLPPVPLAAKRPDSPLLVFNISFDQTGGTCRMRWASEESNTLLWLDFTAKDSDVPVIP
ncbi:MAG TPA: hypothetical protein VJS37_05365 [Terriglobales bacterium]|nr:hypothetical protein [Terriglobales bacterium]